MGSISAAISRNRQQSRTKETYSPDLEATGQGYANALYGNGAYYGGVGMSGGQYVGDQATQGWGTTRFGDQGQQYLDPRRASGGLGPYGGAGTQLNPYTSGDSQYPGTGREMGYQNQGKYGQQGGGGYQFGGEGGGGAGMGGYSAMGPYQWGMGGAEGNRTEAGGAAYGGYQQLGRDYARMGSRGVTRGERANLMSASNEPIQAQLAASRDVLANRSAQSGNSAGYLSGQARLGASAGQALGSADRQNQIAILQENQRRKEAGLAGRGQALGGIQGMYGTETGYAGNLLAGRANLAKLKREGYTEGAGTGGTVSGSYSGG